MAEEVADGDSPVARRARRSRDMKRGVGRTCAVFSGLLGLYVVLCCSSSEAPCPRRDTPGCPGSPGTEIRFPLTPGNKWVYSETEGHTTYERTDSITGYVRFKGERYAILERRSVRATDTKLVRQVGSVLFMIDADDTVGVRGDSLRQTLPWVLVDFDGPQGARELYRVHYLEADCGVPALEWETVANRGREEYALNCCLLSKVQNVRTNRTTEGPCPAYELTEETVYHIADEVGIVWEQYRWEVYEPGNPRFGGTVETRLVSWEVQPEAAEANTASGPSLNSE